MRAITRQDGFQYYNWWKDRLIDKPGRPSLSPNTANRDIGNIRVLFEAYFKHIGKEDRLNPFRNLSFKTKKVKGEAPPFELSTPSLRRAAGRARSLISWEKTSCPMTTRLTSVSGPRRSRKYLLSAHQ